MNDRLLNVAWMLVALLLITAWPQAAAAEENAAAPAVVELQSAGEQPRRELRYLYNAGDKGTMVMLMDMALNNTINGNPSPSMPIPTQRMEMTVAVENVTDDDTLECRFELTAVDLVEDPDAPSPMAGQMRQMLSTMIGLGGTYTHTRRGQVSNVTIVYPEGIHPAVRQSMSNMEQLMGQSAVPLPAEPIGAGATWSVTQPMNTPAFTFEQKATYTLVELTEHGATMRMTVEQSAPAQDMNMPGASMRLTEFQGRGSGELMIDFTQVIPHVSTDVTSTNQIETVANGQPMKVRTRAQVTVAISPKADETE